MTWIHIGTFIALVVALWYTVLVIGRASRGQRLDSVTIAIWATSLVFIFFRFFYVPYYVH